VIRRADQLRDGPVPSRRNNARIDGILIGVECRLCLIPRREFLPKGCGTLTTTIAHVSRSTLKRTLKKLIQRKLVKVEWYTKRASVFTVYIRRLSLAKTIDLGINPNLYDLFYDDDRSLFRSCKRALSPKELREIEEDAGNPRLVDVLIFRRAFGPDRQRKYEALVEKFAR
jgi:hypothetical protein